MLSLKEWAMYVITCLVAAGTPGPGTLAVITSSIQYGSKKTFPLMTGIAFGLGIVSIFTLLGLSRILAESRSAFMALQYVGVTYIMFLGARCIKESLTAYPEDKNPIELKHWGVFSGIWISVLNPKTFLFFMAFFPTYLGKSQDETQFYLGLVLGTVLVACTFSVHVIYSLAGQKLSDVFIGKGKQINLVSGAVFIALGAMMVF